MEERFRNENLELQRRIEQEGGKNVEISTSIKDLEAKIRIREDSIVSLRKELEGSRYSNSALLDNNANLQSELEALNQHIRVLTQQNEDLTKELDHFVEANEAIRTRLDRKSRVYEIRSKNEV